MTRTALRDGVVALEEEMGRLELLRRQIGSATDGEEIAAPVAQIGERLTCTLEIALCALERDKAQLLSLARSQSAG
jgi:hypothetical protein